MCAFTAKSKGIRLGSAKIQIKSISNKCNRDRDLRKWKACLHVLRVSGRQAGGGVSAVPLLYLQHAKHASTT
jgi:hypothetical protein